MESIYIRQVKFDTLKTDEEKYEFQDYQTKEIFISWLKRLAIAFGLIALFVLFQIGARYAAPHRFSMYDTITKLVKNAAYVFLAFNILSYLELMFQHKVSFDIEKAPVAKFVVKKKMTIHILAVIPQKIRFLICEYDGKFVIDRVYVNSFISFTNIKEGQTIYVERQNDDGHYQYYYIA